MEQTPSQYFQTTGLNPHPANSLENQHLGLLSYEFWEMADQVSKLFSDSNNFYTDSNTTWMIFMGVSLNGNRQYACHIAEGLTTCKVYNSQDIQYDYPVMVMGKPLLIKDDLMAEIRRTFPVEFKGIVPAQIAFSIVYTGNNAVSNQVNLSDLINLINGTSQILCGNIQVSYLGREVGDTLSFKRNGFPFEFWTHKSRFQALQRVKTIKEAKLNEQPPEKQQEILNEISVYSDLIKLDKEVRDNLQKQKKASEDLKNAQNVLVKYTDCVDNLEKDSSYVPENGLEWLKTADKSKVIKGKKDQADKAQKAFEEAKSDYNTSKAKLDEEIQKHSPKLPTSYLQATFQISLDLTINSKKIYKQFDGETGGLLYCLNVDIKNVNHVRFLDSVHIPYSY